MKVKDKFILIKDIPNVLNYPSSVVDQYADYGELENMIRSIRLIENRVNHFTSKKVLELTSNVSITEKHVQVVNIDKYPLPVTYNKQTKKILLNLSAFGVSEISRLDPKTVYGSLAYGLCFRDLAEGSTFVKPTYSGPITNFLLTIFIRLFGKEYGLLGIYAAKIPAMKFLLSTYIMVSFFGIDHNNAYKKSSTFAGYDYKQDINQLKDFDFNRIDELIRALSEFKIMPGLNKYGFTAKVLKFLSLNFLPALEDNSRFISSIMASNISGNGIIPSFIYTYNTTEYNKILEISKTVFK